MIKYLKNEEFSCSNKLQLVKNNCKNYNLKNNFHISNLNLYSGVDPIDNSLRVFKQNFKYKKIINRFYTVNQEVENFTGLSNFSTPDLNSNSTICGCSNVITGIDYKFYLNKTFVAENEVVYYLEDITDTCGKTKRMPISYKVSFIGYNKVNIFYLMLNLIFYSYYSRRTITLNQEILVTKKECRLF